MENTNILVVDDERKIRDLVRLYLEKEGFNVGEADDGQKALNIYQQGQYELIVLDLMMPGMDGWEVCKEVRRKSNVPIIMLTARDDEMDRVLGLELGADDYVAKPFSPRELVARVKAVLRRSQAVPATEQPAGEPILQFPGLSINPELRLVLVDGRSVTLTPKEYELLYQLARSPRRIFTRDELLETIWGYDYMGDTRTVDTHINRLRDKLLKASGNKSSYIATVWGVGYRLEVN
ncbi:MAG TPA: DNA-binding response regulator [Desulfotomaculum sp.]|nr:DNA-binding response regulator [Desulfotomaculum sp.]